MRLRFVLRSILCLFAISPVSVYATPFTPQEWRQEVKTHPNQAHVGRLKHTTWVRDQNRNFIDDTIERRFGLFDKKISNGWHELAPEVKDSKVNIIVDFNSFMTIEEIRKKFQSPEQYYGDLKYICKTITSIFLDNVNVQHLPAIARMDEVALIEIQHAFQPALDISTRAIQAKATTLSSRSSLI